MQYNFLNIFLDQKDLLVQTKSDINPFLLENNSAQIEKIYNFYKSNVNLLYVNGFSGTGKAKIVDYSLAFLASETITLKYNCFNSTVLDDILLSFFSEFKNLSAQNIISEPKIKVENFAQKVNSYFSQTERSFVIILDSFESVLDENRQEIIDFVLHLISLTKVKVIVIARTFESKYFKGIELERVSTYALDKSIFDKYLKSEKIKSPGTIIDEFYKYTRGYYFFTALSIKLMKDESLSLTEFLVKLKDSYTTFNDFLGKRALTLISATERNLFWLLAMVRHPLSIELLKKLNFYNEEKIDFLIKNLIIAQDNLQLYVRDYLKDFAYDTIAPNIAQKVHEYVIDLYSTQLPLKPLERDICISRQTMRKEVEYHKLFLPKRPKNIENPQIDIDYLSYSTVNDFSSKDKKEENKPKEIEKGGSAKTPPIDLTQRKNVSLNIENLPFQNKPEKTSEPLKEEEDVNNIALKELMQLITKAELIYKYTKVIDLGKKALLLKEDTDYQGYLPLIYVKIAYAYQKIANYDNSLNYYTLAQNAYINSGNLLKANHIKLNIGRIYYDTYKFDKAKEILSEIISQNENPPSLKTKAYIQLANLEENMSNQDEAFKYLKQAVEIVDNSMDVTTLSEVYFKYALAVDDKNDTKTAVDFYNKCINLSDDFKVNKFLSSAFSNIATLYAEKNDIENAILNYSKAYEIDKQNSNSEGMYYAASKLASLLKKKDPEKALEYFYTALDCANLTKDVFYIVSAALALGDYNYDRRENEIALKNYLYALDLAENNFSQDNINKINVRINDLKFKMGVEKFENLVELIKTSK